MQLIEGSNYEAQNQAQTQEVESIKKEFSPVGIGDWFFTLFVASIPILGFIMLLVWIFSNNTNPNKANWAKAMMIWKIIGLLIVVIIGISMGAAVLSALSSYY